MADQPAPAEECNCEAGAPKWVVTFGDMMSLLLCFFVLLLSFSTTDIIKYRQLVGSMKDAFGIAQTSPTTDIPSGQKILQNIVIKPSMAALVAVRSKALKVSKSSSQLEMESGADWVRLKVDGDALFDSGAYDVKPAAGPILDQIGDLINDFDGTVTIEGHTDGDPPRVSRFEAGSYLGNYELGSLRSIAVLGYLVRNKSVDMSKLIPVSLGEAKPRETNDLAAGKARNRRVEFEFRGGSQAEIGDVDGRVIKPD